MIQLYQNVKTSVLTNIYVHVCLQCLNIVKINCRQLQTSFLHWETILIEKMVTIMHKTFHHHHIKPLSIHLLDEGLSIPFP